MQSVPIYCVSLPSRKHHCEEFFRRLRVLPEYVEPCLAKDIKYTVFKRPQPANNVQMNYKSTVNSVIDTTAYSFVTKKYNAYPSKLACSISHRNAMKLFLQSHANACLVFEDDNVFPTMNKIQEFHYWYRWLSVNYDEFNLVNLSPCFSSRNVVKSGLHPNLYKATGYCMNCYAVSKQGAHELLQAVMTTKNHTLDMHIPSITSAYEVHPRVFVQNVDSSLLNNMASPPEFV